ncbi:MAG: tetratricopeptide repeat protein [Gammaproteobacteria bacterium]|nr:tetratricopeptide repeat protein [Gammaproteobacteria bacterium]
MALAVVLLGGCASAPPPAPDPAPTLESSVADAATPTPAAPVVPERASQQFAEALAHLQAGRNTDAELELRQLELAYPQFAAPSINLGLLYQRAGKLEQAAQSLEEAVKRDPANALSQTELGLVYRAWGVSRRRRAPTSRHCRSIRTTRQPI